MAQVSRATIASYFQTGDVPTQAQFQDLIDSVAWYDGSTAGGGSSGYSDLTFAASQPINTFSLPGNIFTGDGVAGADMGVDAKHIVGDGHIRFQKKSDSPMSGFGNWMSLGGSGTAAQIANPAVTDYTVAYCIYGSSGPLVVRIAGVDTTVLSSTTDDNLFYLGREGGVWKVKQSGSSGTWGTATDITPSVVSSISDTSTLAIKCDFYSGTSSKLYYPKVYGGS